jgi:DNA-binding XRE family transcriptional regulator/GGDEF domain-containing protein
MGRRRDDLAARRRSRGLTQEALAHRLQVERTTVARWEAGDTTPLPWVRPRLAVLLQVTPNQLASILDTDGNGPGLLAAASPDTPVEPPGSGTETGAGRGRAENAAAAVRATSAYIVALDVRSGTRHLVDAAVHAAQRAHHTAMSRFGGDRDVLAAAAEAQQIAGWVAFDAEHHDLSRRMSLEALLSARTAGDRCLEHLVLGQLAMQDVHLHQPVEADSLSSAALESGVSGRVRTMFTLRAARAAAQKGEDARARSTTAGMVHLDHLGFPQNAAGKLLVRCDGVPESARQRLVNAGADIVEDPEQAVEAFVVSTRLPPDELRRVGERLGARVGRTIVLAHTGAERLAAQLVRSGADAVVGEGNEEALIGLVDQERTPTALLASFERRFGGVADGANGRGRDPATGLHDRRAFERRLGALGDAEEIPRVGFLKVVSDRWNTGSPDAVVASQRRRLATTLEHVARSEAVELFSTGNGEFGIISEQLSPHDAIRVGNRLVEAAATYRDRGLPLRAAVDGEFDRHPHTRKAGPIAAGPARRRP